MYKFTIEEIERAFDDWAKSCGVSDDALADAWHAIVIRLGIIAARELQTPHQQTARYINQQAKENKC